MKKKIDIESLERKSPHQVPDGYFDELPLKIQSRIITEKESTRGVYISKMQLVWSMTAAVAIFFLGWLWYPQSNEQLNAEQLLADINSEDLIEYLYEEDISTDEILATIDQSYLIEEMTDLENDMINEGISEEDLENIYLELDYSTEIWSAHILK